jgi:CubicO group peptidase (beta-lactamase class C family)
VAARGASGGGRIPAAVSPRLGHADDVVRRGMAAGIFPGGVLAVGRHDGPMHLRRFGQLSTHATEGSVELDTLYDLASLTKVVARTSVAMVLTGVSFISIPRCASPAKASTRPRERLVFRPLGMTDTVFRPDAARRGARRPPSTTHGGDGSCAAKCRTRTPIAWEPSPDTPASSAPRAT